MRFFFLCVKERKSPIVNNVKLSKMEEKNVKDEDEEGAKVNIVFL